MTGTSTWRRSTNEVSLLSPYCVCLVAHEPSVLPPNLHPHAYTHSKPLHSAYDPSPCHTCPPRRRLARHETNRPHRQHIPQLLRPPDHICGQDVGGWVSRFFCVRATGRLREERRQRGAAGRECRATEEMRTRETKECDGMKLTKNITGPKRKSVSTVNSGSPPSDGSWKAISLTRIRTSLSLVPLVHSSFLPYPL